MNNSSEKRQKLRVGWREWVALPDLGILAIKAKLDTGARTSALHAFKLETFTVQGQERVRFWIHPRRKRTDLVVTCETDIVDRRVVSDSGGHREERLVIRTAVVLADRAWPIEITLTNREDMLFRMLLGRTALRRQFVIDPARSFRTGKKLAKKYSAK